MAGGCGRPECLGEPVEQAQAKCQGDLLAGDGSDQGLEYAGEAGRLEAPELLGQWPQPGVGGGKGVERSQVHRQAQDAGKWSLPPQPRPVGGSARCQVHLQAWLLGRAPLSYGHLGWTAGKVEDAPVGLRPSDPSR